MSANQRGTAGAVRSNAATEQIGDRAVTAFLAEHPAPGAPIVVVIPALDEQDAVAAVIAAVPSEICGLSTETLIMDDGSNDATAMRARAAGALVCSFPVNLGQGVALRLGYRIAIERGARFIATADADGQFDPAELPSLVAPLVNDEADFVNGSRRLGHSHTTDLVRRTGVVVFGGLITLLTRTKITDPANGLRAFTVEVAAAVPLRQPQYQTSELLIGALARGFRVIEVPATMYVRKAGTTKKGGNLIYGLRFARVVITTWWQARGAPRHDQP
jgi:glycosyltransferase involved in cell wall biosynthesis